MKCVTAFYYCVQETQRLRTDLLYIIDINTDQDILDLVRNLIDIMAQRRDILSLDRCDKGFHQHIAELMLRLVCLTLDFMEFIKVF